jgi:ATP-dependent NAD(P)H-hydrate dehydratase
MVPGIPLSFKTILSFVACHSLTCSSRAFSIPRNKLVHFFPVVSQRRSSPEFKIIQMTTSISSSWSDLKSISLERCFLPLSSNHHKGSSGRIGILGGSALYTGAPYYAGMAALQTGADLVYLFCAQEAASAIKSYSPEIMVQPVYEASKFSSFANMNELDEEGTALVSQMVEKVVVNLDRLHTLVIGPGLGRCPIVFEATSQIMLAAMARGLALIVDADGLFLLTQQKYRGILANYEKVVLTPNIMEYNRLAESYGNWNKDSGNTDFLKQIMKGYLIKKGVQDVIIESDTNSQVMICTEEGGLKRSGGLGDILAGVLATFLGWQVILHSREDSIDWKLACWSACCVTKRATQASFRAKRRAMTAPDVLNEIGSVMIDMEREDKSC